MGNLVYRSVELIGVHPGSWELAAQNAVAAATLPACPSLVSSTTGARVRTRCERAATAVFTRSSNWFLDARTATGTC